jgi:hypothetical protein
LTRSRRRVRIDDPWALPITDRRLSTYKLPHDYGSVTRGFRPKSRGMSMHTDSETAQELADRAHRLLEEVVLPVERDLAPEPSRTSVRPPASTTCAPYRHTAEYGEMGRGLGGFSPSSRSPGGRCSARGHAGRGPGRGEHAPVRTPQHRLLERDVRVHCEVLFAAARTSEGVESGTPTLSVRRVAAATSAGLGP